MLLNTVKSLQLLYINNMASIMDLCRLCTKLDEFSKDLRDKLNVSTLKLVQDYTQIVLHENDNLPTKICLCCEEKIISFQLFVLNCHKNQEHLIKLVKQNDDEENPIKDEIELQTKVEEVKSEVKMEMTAEDIVNALNEEKGLSFNILFEEGNREIREHHDEPTELNENDEPTFHDDSDDGSLSDNMAISTLKQIKTKTVAEKRDKYKDLEALQRLLNTNTDKIKVKELIKFDCIICDIETKNWTKLHSHYRKRHRSEPTVICLCGFEITSRSVMYKHVLEHKEEHKKLKGENDEKYNPKHIKDYVNFICDQCSVVCSSWYTLKAHCIDYHNHSAPTVTCRCGIVIKSKSVLYNHVKDHKKPYIISCDKCSKILKDEAALLKHKLRHVPKEERRFDCNHCGKIFATKEAVKSHERSHIPIEERKVYCCDVCEMKFTTRNSLTSHHRIVHEKIKGFVCDLCGYACGTNGELRQHRAIHYDDKPFHCTKCPKNFKTYSNLKTHMDTHEDTAYECYICRRVLNSRRTLRKHLLVHEDKCIHSCSYCNKSFKRRQTLKVHMYTHTGDKPLSCKWCDERFSYASTLRSHRLRCHPDKLATQAHDYTHQQHTYGVRENFGKTDAVVSVHGDKNGEGEVI